MVTSAKYMESGAIAATINGVDLFVPDDMANRHRQIVAEWEAEGNTILDYAPPAPSTDPADSPLTMRQLRVGLVQSGFPVEFIASVIAAIPADIERAIATIWYEESTTVQWAHPMTRSLIAAAGIGEAEARAMWLAAKDIAA